MSTLSVVAGMRLQRKLWIFSWLLALSALAAYRWAAISVRVTRCSWAIAAGGSTIDRPSAIDTQQAVWHMPFLLLSQCPVFTCVPILRT
jgi:hypothetical protein